MSGAKFTKGEWFISECSFVDGCIITSSSRDGMVQICSIDSAYFDGCERNQFEIEQEANAHLIAAAPEMYEMLDKFVRCVDDDSSEDFLYQYQDIKNLLAKARGEA